MAYVYRHIRLDTNQVFYVGIGSDAKYKRASWPYGRNNIWRSITSKTDFKVEIIFDGLSFAAALIKTQNKADSNDRKCNY